PLLSVHGRVTYRGVPVRAGTVVFVPDGSRGCHGPLAQAELQSDGSYTLRTEDAAGAAAGWYRVTVASVRMPEGPTEGGKVVAPITLVPEKYRSPDLSGLSCEVRTDRDNRIDFNLE